MIDASSRAGKSPVVTIFKSRKRRSSSPDLIHRDPYSLQTQTHYQHATYHPGHHYPSPHPTYYPDPSSPAVPYMPQSFPSCQYLSTPQTNNILPQTPPLPTCMEARPQLVQPSFEHWTSSHYAPNYASQNYTLPGHPTDTQHQHGQFFVKAS